MTVTSIADALAATITGVTGINYVSVDSFMPTLQATTAAVIIAPFSQESVATFDTLDGSSMTLVHRIVIEVWVRYRPDNVAATMDAGRDVALDVLAAIYGNDGAGYTLASNRETNFLNEDGFREIATGLVFLVGRMGIWVEEIVTV